MFTVEEIEFAHSKVKSGAEFPKYIQEIKELGVVKFETFVEDSHTVYFGKDDFRTNSKAKYAPLQISEKGSLEKFMKYLKIHQNGETDYFTFCRHCAETGVEKWIVDLHAYTCTYFDRNGVEVLVEKIPQM